METKTQTELNADMLYVIDLFTGSNITHGHNQKSLTYVEDKLKQGAEPNATYSDGSSALMIAIKNDSLDIIELLLKHGANPDLDTGKGTPLSSVASVKPTDDIARRLIEHGANVNLPTAIGTTLLYDAVLARRPETVKLLLEHGASVDVGSNSYTPLTIACRFGYPELVELLIEAGADVNMKDGKGAPIYHAFAKLQTGRDERMAIAERLIQCGAKVDIMVKKGQSLLQFAAEGNDRQAVSLIEQALLKQVVADTGRPADAADTTRRINRKRL